MKKVFIVMAVLLGILVVVSSCSPTSPQEEVKFRVEVSRFGFDKNPGEFRLDVEAGQEVEITFVYGDGDFDENNPHIIAIPDYGLETGVLDRENPEVTVSFTAGSAGEVVAFTCIRTACVGHAPNLQGGTIVIQPGS